MSAQKKTKYEDQLTQLAKMTILVCDTGDIEAIRRLKPTDATTNPSLLWKAAGLPQYKHLVDDAVEYGKKLPKDVDKGERLAATMDRLAVNFGAEITKIVPGYVSTEVDARISFHTDATVARARRIIKLYEEVGVPKSRILIKIASTWEGIKAAEILEKDGITCNLTLLFSLCQAIAAAEASATLVSPFVGRILDWYKKETGKNYEPEEDPGVQSVRQIYGYYKKHGYKTIVMGASFRNKGEILALAGCDRLTISPQLLEELKGSHDGVKRVLDPATAGELYQGEKTPMTEQAFRLALNGDPMATAKLAEGIRGFAGDIEKLEKIVAGLLTPADALADQFTKLAEMTTIVCDTGDVDAIKRLKPTDATTNPSLIYKAASLPRYQSLVESAIKAGKEAMVDSQRERLDLIMDRLAVNFGTEITKIVPGYVSTEVDARLSFNTEGTVARARRIIKLYEEVGVPKSRILIKMASTWEGIKAAEILEKEGITCNLTLLFSLCQAVAAAEAGATLISPFVGRILDWYKKETGKNYEPDEDPGVQSVRSIYGYFKKYGYNTIVMGASFRSKGEIVALAGCDRLTISPQLLDELKQCHEPLPKVLDPDSAAALYKGDKQHLDERAFRFELNADPMATDKLAEGIRGFSADIEKLEQMVLKKL